MRIDFVKRFRNDGDEQVEHDDGHEDGVDDEQNQAILAAYGLGVVVVELTQADQICIIHASKEAFGLRHELVGIIVGGAHYFEGITKGNDGYSKNEHKVTHVDHNS